MPLPPLIHPTAEELIQNIYFGQKIPLNLSVSVSFKLETRRLGCVDFG